MYGITETTVHVTYQAITAATVAAGDSGIGVPIPDLRTYVLDERMAAWSRSAWWGSYTWEAPAWRADTGSAPTMTAERFVPDPFGRAIGARLYRTGDLARLARPDATLRVPGAPRRQVKLRGYRIELGEIEAVLAECPAVAEAAVAMQPGVGGEKRLVGYVVARVGVEVSAAELRRHAQRLLPSPMVPAAWVILEALPRTPGGKVDRRALPAPTADRPHLKESYAAPRTEVENVSRVSGPRCWVWSGSGWGTTSSRSAAIRS